METQESLSLIGASPTKPTYATECPHCGAWWVGLNTCHCTACHSTFTGVTAFDKHRDGSHSHSTRHCIEPANVGLVDAGRNYPCWANPGSYNPREDNR